MFHSFRLQGLLESPEAFGSTYEEESVLSAEMVKNRFSCTDEQFVLGAFGTDGGLVGVAGFLREKKLKLRHRGMIWGMYVDPRHRGEGVGKALLRAIIEKCSPLPGLEQILLDVVIGKEAARHLYLSHGFQISSHVERVMKHNEVYYDVEHMVLHLPHISKPAKQLS